MGALLVYAINNAGRHFENASVQPVSTMVKMMIAFSAVFTFSIISIGGFIH